MKTLFWIQGLSCGANTQSFLCMEQKDLEEKAKVYPSTTSEYIKNLLKDIEIPQDIHIHF
jgi:hypothetical protein